MNFIAGEAGKRFYRKILMPSNCIDLETQCEALDSFIIVFDQKGTILYVSEGVTSLLGHLPKDLVNVPLYNFIHKKDLVPVHGILSSREVPLESIDSEIVTINNQVSFKCSMKRASFDPESSCSYENVDCQGTTVFKKDAADTPGSHYFYFTVRLHTPQILTEMPIMDESVRDFTSRLSMEWKFLYLDHRASLIIGYLPIEVLGTSGYNYYHSDDLVKVSECHEQLLKAGEGSSCCYRFLSKGRQWIWIKSSYYITYNQWNCKPEFIVCNNRIVSHNEARQELRMSAQFQNSSTSQPVKLSISTSQSSTDQTTQSTTAIANVSTEPEALEQPSSTNCDMSPLHKVLSNQLDNLLQHYLKQQSLKASKQQTVTETSQDPEQPRPTVLSSLDSGPTTSYSVRAVRPPSSRSPQVSVLPRPNISSVIDAGPSTSSGIRSVRPVKPPSSSPFVPAVPVPRTDTQMSPLQRNIRKQLFLKSDMLQKAIQKQQDELHSITQQLAFSCEPPIDTGQSGSRIFNLSLPNGSEQQSSVQPVAGPSGVIVSSSRTTMPSLHQSPMVLPSPPQRQIVVPSHIHRQNIIHNQQQHQHQPQSTVVVSGHRHKLYDQSTREENIVLSSSQPETITLSQSGFFLPVPRSPETSLSLQHAPVVTVQSSGQPSQHTGAIMSTQRLTDIMSNSTSVINPGFSMTMPDPVHRVLVPVRSPELIAQQSDLQKYGQQENPSETQHGLERVCSDASLQHCSLESLSQQQDNLEILNQRHNTSDTNKIQQHSPMYGSHIAGNKSPFEVIMQDTDNLQEGRITSQSDPIASYPSLGVMNSQPLNVMTSVQNGVSNQPSSISHPHLRNMNLLTYLQYFQPPNETNSILSGTTPSDVMLGANSSVMLSSGVPSDILPSTAQSDISMTSYQNPSDLDDDFVMYQLE